MISKDDAKSAIVTEWLALPPQKRRNFDQASVFALKALSRFPFTTAGNRYEIIKGWLTAHIELL